MSSAVTRAAKMMGRKGGKARAAKLSPERQREIAALGGLAKAAKANQAKDLSEPPHA